MRPLPIVMSPPSFTSPISQACTARQFDEPALRYWADAAVVEHRRHRVLWERAYTAQALARHGMLAPGRRGLGLETDDLQLAMLFRARGCDLVVGQSDAAPLQAWEKGLGPEKSRGLSFELRHPLAPCSGEEGFDFVWSTTCLARQPSLADGRAALLAALSWLMPGGVLVFTLNYECQDDPTQDSPFWSQKPLLALLDELARQGYDSAVNLHLGDQPDDRHIDRPPYSDEPHIKLAMGDRIFTSFGLILKKTE